MTASALVVGLEKYGSADTGDIEGSVLLAARFAQWLVDQKVCPPERITFLYSYDEAKYQEGGLYKPALSPTDQLEKLRAGKYEGINIVRHAHADTDFADWINSPQYGPRPADERFVFFWIGHGVALQQDLSERVYLLGSDADDVKLRNVELLQLLTTVCAVAPRATVTAFVQACRAPIPDGYEQDLASDSQPVRPDPRPVDEGSVRNLRVVYAAAHGESTKMAAPEDATFADALLTLLDTLPMGSGPEAIFDDGQLDELIERLRWEGIRPYQASYGTRHGDRLWSETPPPNDANLSREEWDILHEEAERIDREHGTTGLVRWGAYCQAVGLGGGKYRPELLKTLKDLFFALRSLPPSGDRRDRAAPPLLIACDFVAHLAGHDLSGLVAWCDAWAHARGRDGVELLKAVRHVRPDRLEDRPYLSIMVGRAKPTEPQLGRRPLSRYELYSLFYAVNDARWLPDQRSLARSEILDVALDSVIAEAVKLGIAAPEKMIVEFVLPRGLLGWWLEYEQPHLLGSHYPVVIRDWKRAAHQDGFGAGFRAQERLRLARANGSPRSSQAAFLCAAGQPPVTTAVIGATARSRETVCIVLARAPVHTLNGGADVVPDALASALDAGAPIVVSLEHPARCGGCHSGAQVTVDESGIPVAVDEDNGSACPMRMAWNRIRKQVDDGQWADGLLDLPFILQAVRDEITLDQQLAELKLSVLMEDPGRLWPGYFQLGSGYQQEPN